MKPDTLDKIDIAIDEVRAELIAAYEKFPDYRSAHEGVAIIEEEFIELRDAAYWPHKHEDEESEETEACQLAAMAIRYLVDVCYTEGTPR
jgi:hypothetical protein